MRELALHLLDLMENAIEAGATLVTVAIVEDVPKGELRICVADNGRGMAPEVAARSLDPFWTTRATRHVGLGLPLLASAAERTGGGLEIVSAPGAGTEVTACFGLEHPDRQPLGDVPGSLLVFLLAEGSPDLVYRHRVVEALGTPGEEFVLDTREVRAALDGAPISEPVVILWLRDALNKGERSLASRA
jgi:hypothetical protein